MFLFQKKTTRVGIEKLAEDKVRDTFRRFDPNAEVEILSANSVKVKVAKQFIPSVIGRGGSTINDLEKILKVHIDVVPKESSDHFSGGFELPFDFSESSSSLLFNVGKDNASNYADIYLNNDHLVSSRVTRKGQIKIPKRSPAGIKLMKHATSRDSIQIFIKN